MINITRQDLEDRLDQIDADLEELQDKITGLKRERDRVANMLDDILDEENS